MTDHQKIVHAFTEHDRRESLKRHYNRYALAQYCEAGSRVAAYVSLGYNQRDAVLACFCGPLANKILRALGLPLMTKDEARYGVKLPCIELE
jgi:hypothetical protein